MTQLKEEKLKNCRIALLGNPNCGKTSLFNQLTQSKALTGNYAQVTLTSQQATLKSQESELTIVDLPGVYSLSSNSQQERVISDELIHHKPDIVVNVIDSTQLERSLFLSTQLIEKGVKLIFVLNMIDESSSKGIAIDRQQLSQLLKAPVFAINSRNAQGVDKLIEALHFVSSDNTPKDRIFIRYDEHLETAIETIRKNFLSLHPTLDDCLEGRWIAIKLLESDPDILEKESEHQDLVQLVRQLSAQIETDHDTSVTELISQGRYGFINGLLQNVISESGTGKRYQFTPLLDKIFLHPIFGLPIFFFLMWLIFETTFVLGNYPMEWIDVSMRWLSLWVEGVLPESLTRDLIVHGILAGIGSSLIFIPNIALLFFFIALLSETGYLARTAFLMDRLMRIFGLHGKAVIPLVMGFGCNVPAILATRTIEDRKDRLVAILVNPYMSCSARLPIFVLFTGAFFPENPGSTLFFIYLLSISVTFLIAIFLSRLVLKNQNKTAFMMELPPFRMPTLHSIVFHVKGKVYSFIKKITGIILVASVIIWCLQTFPLEPQLSRDYTQEIAQLNPLAEIDEIQALQDLQRMELLQKRYLGQIAHWFEPLVEPLGFDLNITIALLTGIAAKEVVVATLGVLHSEPENLDNNKGLRSKLSQSLSPITALAFMAFVLLYMPCLSTIIAIYYESASWQWTMFSIFFSLGLGWSVAFAIKNIATWTGFAT